MSTDLVMIRRAPAGRIGLAEFSRRAALHPQLARRFVALGLLDADRDRAGGLWLRRDQLADAARIRRLHDDLSLNYAAVGLVLDLLDRIRRLETALRQRPSEGGVRWIRTD
jgi:hypothetical protein